MRYFAISLLCVASGCHTLQPAAVHSPASEAPLSQPRRNAANQLQKPYVILVSFDGFRADYLDRYSAPNFARIARSGVRAKGMIPAFPSKTFPNHYSIVTGAYPSRHGLVANKFWDPARRQSYSMDNRLAVVDGTWYHSDPIWVSAEKQGMLTASFDWVAGDAVINGVRPSRFTVYKGSTTPDNRADSVLSWLSAADSVRPHLIAVYMSDVDHAGHDYGPFSPHVASAISRVDSALGKILDGVSRLPVATQTYVVLVADHGMTEVSPDTYIEIGKVMDTTGVMITEDGPVVNMHVSGGLKHAVILRDSLNRRLGHGRAYLRQDVPSRFHYRSDPRIGDLVVIMDEHWQLGRRASPTQRGQHGFDNQLPSMYAIFLASGPGIKAGRTIAPFESVEVYSLMTDLLGIRPVKGIDSRSGFLKKRIMQ